MAGWFRLYAEMKSDRKLRRVSAGQRWLWVVMLMYASESPDPGWLLLSKGVPVTIEDLADDAGISLEEVQSGIKAFIAQRMLEDVDGVYHLVNWDKRQFKSDNSTDRWRKWKDRQTISQPVGVSQPAQEQGRASGLQDQPYVQHTAILSGREVNQLSQETNILPVPTFTNVGPTSPDTDTDTDIINADAGAPARENFVTTCKQEFGRLISMAERPSGSMPPQRKARPWSTEAIWRTNDQVRPVCGMLPKCCRAEKNRLLLTWPRISRYEGLPRGKRCIPGDHPLRRGLSPPGIRLCIKTYIWRQLP